MIASQLFNPDMYLVLRQAIYKLITTVAPRVTALYIANRIANHSSSARLGAGLSPYLPSTCGKKPAKGLWANRLAILDDTARVALEVGNSPEVIFGHSRERVTPEAAQAWST
jgi:hypothetical protein